MSTTNEDDRQHADEPAEGAVTPEATRTAREHSEDPAEGPEE
ncbi:hypothetical protein [Cellulomonas sp. HZM]|nr:hypothetical protein [Cellulomonas sp. HZM]